MKGLNVNAYTVLGNGIRTYIAKIGPDEAEDYLARIPKKARHLRPRHMSAIARDMKAGRYMLNGEPIIISSDGIVLDGQHRMWAIITSGVTIETLVVEGVDPEVYKTLNGCARRTGSDALAIYDIKNTTLVSGAAAACIRYLSGEWQRILTQSEIVEFVQENPDLIEVIERHHTLRLVCNRPSSLFMTAFILRRNWPSEAETFFDRLRDGINLDKGNPILLLRNKLLDIKAKNIVVQLKDMTALVFLAWNLWRDGKRPRGLPKDKIEEVPEPH